MYRYNAELVRIVDGDTIIAMVDLGFSTWKKVTVRLYGINTPETRTRDLDEKAKGLAAKERLTEILVDENEGKFILESFGVGKFGRCLADIWIRDANINRQLVTEGHAKEYTGGKR